MKKFILIFFLLCAFTQFVSAEALVNNVNASVQSYSNSSVSLNYTLDISDALSSIKIDFELVKNNFPYTLTFTFKDNKNQVLKIYEKYTLNKGFPLDNVGRETRVTLNGNEIKVKDLNTRMTTNLLKTNYTQFNPFSTTSSFNVHYMFESLGLTYNRGVLFYRFEFVNNLFIKSFDLSNISSVTYNNINIEYLDNGVATTEASLNAAFNGYNVVFKLIFILAKGTFKFLNVVGGISDIDYYNYQNDFVGEGSIIFYLNALIGLILFTFRWIFTMGLLWTISIISMGLFLYAYSKSIDLMDCFRLFWSYETSFFQTVFIKPAIFIYTKIVLFWTGK